MNNTETITIIIIVSIVSTLLIIGILMIKSNEGSLITTAQYFIGSSPHKNTTLMLEGSQTNNNNIAILFSGFGDSCNNFMKSSIAYNMKPYFKKIYCFRYPRPGLKHWLSTFYNTTYQEALKELKGNTEKEALKELKDNTEKEALKELKNNTEKEALKELKNNTEKEALKELKNNTEKEALNTSGKQTILLCGFSMGGWFALNAAQYVKEREIDDVSVTVKVLAIAPMTHWRNINKIPNTSYKITYLPGKKVKTYNKLVDKTNWHVLASKSDGVFSFEDIHDTYEQMATIHEIQGTHEHILWDEDKWLNLVLKQPIHVIENQKGQI
jgi:predicted esterase YcpF (UPF0227 family)